MHLTENWRLKGQRYALMTNRNTETQEITFPPRHVATREMDVFKFDENEAEEQRKPEAAVVESVAQ
jgi:hypothetical protein